MHKLRSGLNANTKKKLLLGEGAIFKNFVVGTDTYESARAAGKLLGATQGGSTFTATASVRNIEVDGIPGVVADLEEIDSWEVTLETTFLEVTVETIKAALGAAKSTHADGYTHIEGKLDFDTTDYFTNITFVGSMSGSDAPIILQLRNAIGDGNLQMQIQNGNEGKVPVKFQGRYTIETLSDVPFDIYYPDIMQASKYRVTVEEGATVTVNITGYDTAITATPSNAKATANVSSGTITIAGVADGECIVEVEDEATEPNTLAIVVTVVDPA
jgi:hypothetical protein